MTCLTCKYWHRTYCSQRMSMVYYCSDCKYYKELEE